MKTSFSNCWRQCRWIFALIRSLGVSWCCFRCLYALKKRWHWWERLYPKTSWPNLPETALKHRVPLLGGQLPAIFDATEAVAEAKAMLEGGFKFYSYTTQRVGCPPDWSKNPFTGEDTPRDVHWSRLGDFAFGDIKHVWELSRFSWVFPLIRAYGATQNECYAELFWTLLLDWMRVNEPQAGVQWKCGQEVSIRVMACVVAWGVFQKTQSATPERYEALIQLMAVSGVRIESNCAYAFSQSNNHGISEAVGLLTLGSLFPGLSRANHWRTLGLKHLLLQLNDLVYTDGSFSQHSNNYHRVLLDNLIIAQRVLVWSDQMVPELLLEAIHRATRFLYQQMAVSTGIVPLYGSNDGAHLLPLSACGYWDFRPLMVMGFGVTQPDKPLPLGPWSEALVWLWGNAALPKQDEGQWPVPSDWVAPVGGYYGFRTSESFLMLRAAVLRHRPAMPELLPVFLHWRGIDIVLGTGSYSYRGEDRAMAGWAETRYQNNVIVDGLTPSQRWNEHRPEGGHGLRFPWVRGRLVHRGFDEQGQVQLMQASHDGYARGSDPVRIGRAVVRLPHEGFLVIDKVVAKRQAHHLACHWLLSDHPHHWVEEKTLCLQTNMGDYYCQWGASVPMTFSCVRADPASPRGWFSPYYGVRLPALSCCMEADASVAYFWTYYGPQAATINCRGTGLWLEIKQHNSAGIMEWSQFHGMFEVLTEDRVLCPTLINQHPGEFPNLGTESEPGKHV